MHERAGRRAGGDSHAAGAAHRGRWSALAVAAFASALFSACSSEEPAAECDSSKCAANHVCVQGGCKPACDGQENCPVSYNCVTVIADDGKTQGNYCARLPYAENGSTGQDVPCSTDDQCDAMRGYTCRHGTCKIWGCLTHDDCGPVGNCVEQDGPERVCVAAEGDFAPGHFHTRCPNRNECDTEADFVCAAFGNLDPNASCTKIGCTSDDDCADGYTCIDQLVNKSPCEDKCGLSGTPNDADCIPAAEIGAGTWDCGPTVFRALERRTCVKRSYCMPCETDLDCGAVPNQVCAKDKSGTKICTQLCEEGLVGNCPWSFASECGLFDTELGQPTCAHRFGSCVGAGKPCEPCLEDSDCQGDGYCIDYTSGERACIDNALECSTRADCPVSAGGVQIECGSFNAGHCDVAYSVNNPLTGTVRYGCWLPP